MSWTITPSYFSSATENIVTSGLTARLDAGIVASYPGSGSAWTDLSGNSNNATFFNTQFLIFDSSNSGRLFLDNPSSTNGTYCTIPTVPLSKNSTITMWMRQSSPIDFTDLFTILGSSDATRSRLERNNTGGYSWFVTGGFPNGSTLFSHDGSQFDHISLVFDSVNATCYKNGVQTFQASSSDFQSASSVLIGARSANNFNWCGRVGQFFMYSRPLSASEVLQNYNATRYRFAP